MSETKAANTAPTHSLDSSLYTRIPSEQRTDAITKAFDEIDQARAMFDREVLMHAGKLDDSSLDQPWEVAYLETEYAKTLFTYPSIDKTYWLSYHKDEEGSGHLVDNKLFGLIATLNGIAVDLGCEGIELDGDLYNKFFYNWGKLYGGLYEGRNTAKTNDQQEKYKMFNELMETIEEYI